MSYGGPAVPLNACWDCGSIEHRRGDAACPKPGSLSCAPQWLLDKQAEKNRVRSLATVEILTVNAVLK